MREGVAENFHNFFYGRAHCVAQKKLPRLFYNFFYGRSYCAPAVRADLCSIDVHSFSFEKERTKKANQRLPPLETASVPRYKADWGERHLYPAASPAALPPRAADEGSKSVLLEILFDSGASQMAKTFVVSLACAFCVGVFI
jgi:hypothetical protein